MPKESEPAPEPERPAVATTPTAARLRIPPRALAALPLLACVVFFALPALDASGSGADRALSNVTIGGAPVARHAAPELDADIARYAHTLDERKLAVRLGQKRFELAPKELGLHVDVAATRAEALRAGREGGFLARSFGYWRRRSQPVAVTVHAVLDRAKLAERAAAWEAEALPDRPFQGGITVSGTSVSELAPKPGRRTAMARAEAALVRAFVASESHAVEWPLEAAPAPLPPDAASAAAAEARALLAAPLTLTATEPSATVTLSPAELGPALESERNGDRLVLTVAPDRLAKLLEPLRKSVEYDAVDAKFEVTAIGTINVLPSRPGLRVDLERLPDALRAAAKNAAHTAELPLVHRPEPALTTEQAQALGIRGLVSSFTTRHPCCEKRVSNIHRIADILDGKVVLPGETVSVNALVGPRTLKAGFVPAPTIEEGEMVDSIGGGISQFATTFFNALFHGGYDIVERQPHTYWFPRYPMGHEATLSWPKPDIIFKNDTQAGMLIKTSYTGTSITVKLYGDNGGRKVRAEVSGRQNVIPAPLELIPNPKISPDEEHVKEPGSVGWSVIVSRIVTFPDGTKKEERRRVTYKQRVRRIEVHPCRIPTGEKGYTGEPCPVPENTEAETPAPAPAQ